MSSFGNYINCPSSSGGAHFLSAHEQQSARWNSAANIYRNLLDRQQSTEERNNNNRFSSRYHRFHSNSICTGGADTQLNDCLSSMISGTTPPPSPQHYSSSSDNSPGLGGQSADDDDDGPSRTFDLRQRSCPMPIIPAAETGLNYDQQQQQQQQQSQSCHCSQMSLNQVASRNRSLHGTSGTPSRSENMTNSLELEAIAAVHELSFAVQSISVSEMLPRTPELIFVNVTTVEGQPYCLELTLKGWRVTSLRLDCMHGDFTKLDLHTKYYETPFALMDALSPGYRNRFGEKLAQRLRLLQAGEDNGDLVAPASSYVSSPAFIDSPRQYGGLSPNYPVSNLRSLSTSSGVPAPIVASLSAAISSSSSISSSPSPLSTTNVDGSNSSQSTM